MNFIHGLIVGFIVGIVICVVVGVVVDFREWRNACIQYDLNKCCDNAYDYGFLMGSRNSKDKTIERIRADIEKQIERDFKYAENEEVKVPCHYGIANGLQVALRIINAHIIEEQALGGKGK